MAGGTPLRLGLPGRRRVLGPFSDHQPRAAAPVPDVAARGCSAGKDNRLGIHLLSGRPGSARSSQYRVSLCDAQTVRRIFSRRGVS